MILSIIRAEPTKLAINQSEFRPGHARERTYPVKYSLLQPYSTQILWFLKLHIFLWTIYLIFWYE